METLPIAKTDPKTKTILIVEDDEHTLEYLRQVVMKEGFKTESALDGQAALVLARQIKPDLILLDLMLPRAGGYEVLKDLQGNPETARIPNIIITARSVDQQMRTMLESEPNVVDFIMKPVKAIILAYRLHELLNTISPDERLAEKYREESRELDEKLKGRGIL